MQINEIPVGLHHAGSNYTFSNKHFVHDGIYFYILNLRPNVLHAYGVRNRRVGEYGTAINNINKKWHLMSKKMFKVIRKWRKLMI